MFPDRLPSILHGALVGTVANKMIISHNKLQSIVYIKTFIQGIFTLRHSSMCQTHDKWIKGSQYQKPWTLDRYTSTTSRCQMDGSDHQIHIIRLMGAWKKTSVTYLQPWTEYIMEPTKDSWGFRGSGSKMDTWYNHRYPGVSHNI